MNYLVFHLRRHGDIISSLPSLKNLKDRGNKVSIVVFEEFRASVNLVDFFDEVFVIKRKEIIACLKSQNLNPQQGADILTDLVTKIKVNSFTHYINWTSDRISAYLISYLKNHESNVVGISYDVKGNIEHSDPIVKRFNNIFSQKNITNINQLSIQKSTINTKTTTPFISLKETDYDREIQVAFETIRNQNKFLSKSPKLIGISANASSKEKSIPVQFIEEAIDVLLDDPTIVPILLVGFAPEDESIAESLSNKFSDSLIVIQCNIPALAAALKQLDFVIAPDTMTIHLCSILGTNALELVFRDNWARQAPESNRIITIKAQQSELIENKKYCSSIVKSMIRYLKNGNAVDLIDIPNTYLTKSVGNFIWTDDIANNSLIPFEKLIDYIFFTDDRRILDDFNFDSQSLVNFETKARNNLKECYAISSSLKILFKAFEDSASKGANTIESLKAIYKHSNTNDVLGGICSLSLEILEKESSIMSRSEINSYLKHYVKTIEYVLHYIFKGSQDFQIKRKKELRNSIQLNSLTSL